MPYTYTNQANIERLIEPLFQVGRNKFRGARESIKENLETNLFKLDLSRILNELNNVDESILDDLTYLVGDITDVTSLVLADDGLSYDISGVQFYFDDDLILDDLQLDTINKMSAKLSRLTHKVKKLEVGEI